MKIREFVTKLQNLQETDRLPHAFLLVSAGRGTAETAAREAVAALLCESSVEGQACGECRSCVRIGSGNHPALTWIAPDGASLKIAQIRAALRGDANRIILAPLSVIVFEQAHKLTVDASNSILKWVEDPYPNRLFLFTTTTPGALLPTLLSRVMSVRLEEEAEIGLKESLRESFANSDERFAEVFSAVLELGEALSRGDELAWHSVQNQFSKLVLSGEEALVAVDLLTVFFRDAAAVGLGAKPVLYEDSGSGRLGQIARSRDERRMARLGAYVATARRSLQSRVNPQLVFEALFIRAKQKGL